MRCDLGDPRVSSFLRGLPDGLEVSLSIYIDVPNTRASGQVVKSIKCGFLPCLGQLSRGILRAIEPCQRREFLRGEQLFLRGTHELLVVSLRSVDSAVEFKVQLVI